MMINSGQGLGFRGLNSLDLALLEKWYSMTDYFGYATGFKDFAEIRQRILKPSESNIIISMIESGAERKTIGFVYGEVKMKESQIILWIYTLIIEPDYQRRGFGTLAVNKLLQWAHHKYGALTCVVSVSERNPKGLSFWGKVGFSRSSGLEGSLSHIGPSGIAILQRMIR